MGIGLLAAATILLAQDAPWLKGTADEKLKALAAIQPGLGTVMHFFGSFVDYGVEVKVVDVGEGLFDEAAATETPGGAHDFGGEGLFEDALGGEFVHELELGLGVFFFLAGADEGAGSVEAGAEGV